MLKAIKGRSSCNRLFFRRNVQREKVNGCWIITLSVEMLRFVTKDAIVKEYKLWDHDKAFGRNEDKFHILNRGKEPEISLYIVSDFLVTFLFSFALKVEFSLASFLQLLM
jgi:hypothetical protein